MPLRGKKPTNTQYFINLRFQYHLKYKRPDTMNGAFFLHRTIRSKEGWNVMPFFVNFPAEPLDRQVHPFVG